MEALKAAADRCEAVLCLVSPAWLASKWCLAEFLLAKSLHKRIFGLVIEPVPFERLPPEMTAEWQLCELVGPDRFREFHIEDTTVAFREAGLDRLRRGLERAGLDARGFPWPPPNEPDRAPYRGLRALEPQDAAIFFGRDTAIIRGMDQIRGVAELGVDKLLVVLGASGAGKSSFLRAGLWPRLARDDAHFLPLPVIRPQDAVITGSAGLAAALSATFVRLGVVRPPGPVKTALAAEGAEALGGMLNELAALAKARLVQTDPSTPAPTVILPMDQAEELFNPDGAAETAAFLPMLAAVLATGRRILAIATIRTDRYPRLQDDALLPGVKRALFDLPPMPATEFKSVIEGPARRASEAGRSLDIDPALTEALVADATGADALPLLGFTLERLWLDYGAHGGLTLDDYRAMGGVQGSIEAAVAAALAEPDRAPTIPRDKTVQHSLLRLAFVPWLARVDPATGEKMRRSSRAEDIPTASRAVMERFVAARLLVTDRRDSIDVVEVAHESLLRQWPTLLAWLDADAADLKLAEEIDRAATEWDRNGRQDNWLDHRADRLAAAERLLERKDFRARLGEVGVLYVGACRALAERERAVREAALVRQARLQRRVAWALVAVALVLALGGAGALWQRHNNLALKTDLDARQVALGLAGVNLLTEIAASETVRGNLDGALRIGVHATRRAVELARHSTVALTASAQLAATLWQSNWDLVLRGHEGWVRSAVYSPDGTHIVTTSWDKTARVWDAMHGQQILVLRGHLESVDSAAYSPDSARIVTASMDETARIWDAASGRQIVVLRGHDGWVTSAAYSPDSSRIVTASSDQTARVWDANSGGQITVLRGHTEMVNSAAYSPDGSRIVTASHDYTARIWDASSGRQITILRGHEKWVWSAAYSPDGSRIVTASADNTVRVWDAVTGQQIAVLGSYGNGNGVSSAAYSPDGSRIVTTPQDKTVRVWDAASGRQIAALRGHEKEVRSATYSPDGTRLVTASYDNTARIWNAVGERPIVVLNGHEEPVFSAVYSPDGSRIVTASEDETARIWDSASGRQIAVLRGHKSSVFYAAYSRDGSRIVTASEDETARVWDAASGRQIAVLRGHDGSMSAAVLSATYSPNSSFILTASDDAAARIWDSASGRQIAALNKRMVSASYSPDGTRIVTATGPSDNDYTARIWNAATRQQIMVLPGHGGWVNSAVYSPDGSRIVTASDDMTARVWDAASGRQIAVLRGHEKELRSATYSPDGTRIVTASDDMTARVWDAVSGWQIAVLRGDEKKLRLATYSPDGSRIVTASEDNAARVWDVRLASMSTPQRLTEACTRRLLGLSKLTRAEMDLIGYPAGTAEIDVCEGVKPD
jgi:WD40 repeat protein